jgi:hypothetical protein
MFSAISATRLLVAATLCLCCCGKRESFGSQEGLKIRLKDAPGGQGALQTGGASNARSDARIAVVMCGSPRSFLFPLIHWSIKVNLIDALQANVDVFIRTSIEDNVHGQGISSAGLVRQLSKKELDALKVALEVIKPVKVAYVPAKQELEEMQAAFPSTKDLKAPGYWHDIFRKHDPRRYSMFFNRHQVYKMATDHASAKVRNAVIILCCLPLRSFSRKPLIVYYVRCNLPAPPPQPPALPSPLPPPLLIRDSTTTGSCTHGLTADGCRP